MQGTGWRAVCAVTIGICIYTVPTVAAVEGADVPWQREEAVLLAGAEGQLGAVAFTPVPVGHVTPKVQPSTQPLAQVNINNPARSRL